MKIKAVNCVIQTKDAKHEQGKPFDIDDKEGARLIELGLAKKIDGNNKEPVKPKESVKEEK